METKDKKYQIKEKKAASEVKFRVERVKIVDCSDSAVDLLGLDTRREIEGKTLADFSPEFQGCGQSSFTKFEEIARGLSHAQEVKTSWRFINSENQIIETMITIDSPRFDVTEQYDNNIQLANEHALEIENRQLRQKLREYEKFERSFMMNMSHEIRTPLNAIIGFTQLMEMSNNTSEKERHYLDVIKTNGYNLIGLVDNLIELAQVESGHYTDERTRFQLNDMYEDIKSFINGFIKEKNKTHLDISFFTRECQGDALFADYPKLRTVLVHLLKNAILYTPSGGVNIGCQQISNSNVLFYIQDSGIGIPKEHQPHVFNKFYKVDDSCTSNHHGLGIGLTICKSLIQIMGGDIWFESTIGKGSGFYFTIPMAYPGN